MKTVILFALSMVILAGGIMAQESKTYFEFGGGLAAPMSGEHFKDVFKAGGMFNLGVGSRVSPTFEFLVRFMYVKFNLDDDGFKELLVDEGMFSYIGPDVTVDGGSLTGYGLMLNGKYIFPSANESRSFLPYLIGGVGFLHGEEMENATLRAYPDDIKLTDLGEASTDFTVNFGLGTDIMVSPTVAIFLEGTYSITFSEDENTGVLPVCAGLKLHLGQ